MNSQGLWDKLSKNALVTGDKPKEDVLHIPWYIRFMQGFAGWLAALFLLGFFAAVFAFVFHKPTGGLLISLGVLCSIGAYIFIRTQNTDFLEQLGMAFSLSGQLMVAIGLFFLISLDTKVGFYVLGIYQLFLALIIPQYSHRLLTTNFGLLALLIAINLSGLYGIASAFVAVLFAFIWMKETSWGKYRKLWEPIGFGVAITIVFSSGFLIFGKFLLRERVRSNIGWLFQHAELLNSLLIALLFLNFVVVLLKENSIKFDSKTAILSYIVAAMLVLISFKIYGISTGLLLLLIGFARQRITLMVLGCLSILSFFSWYYYNLHMSLLFKSITLVVMGFGMLVAWFGLTAFYGKRRNKSISSFKLQWVTKEKIVVVLTAIIVLVAININISKKQNLIQNGEKLLFSLAPVDPRSLMQGDYMRIRFDLAVKIQKQMRLLNSKSLAANRQGFVVVEKAENDVVSFVSLYHSQELQENQSLIAYKYRNYQVIFTTNAFYFQEGQASRFQKSKFGEFRRSQTGELILVNMIDKDFKVIPITSPSISP